MLGNKDMEFEIINGVEYRKVTLRGRTKLIAKDGSAINAYRRNQKATIHYNADGYPCYGGGVPVHLYVAHAWVDGYEEGLEVNHKDFNVNNNNADNLEWVSHSDNVRYSVKNNSEVWNKSKQGVHNGRATFTENDIDEIRILYDSGLSVADIVRIDYPELQTHKQYHHIHSTYSRICKRETWKSLPELAERISQPITKTAEQ